MLSRYIRISALVACAGLLVCSRGSAGDTGPLRVGAARVDVTPDANALPSGYTAILDHLYVRAIVLDNGHTRAALLSGDLIGFGEDAYQAISKQLAKELEIPVANILISVTHDHSAPLPGGGFGRTPDPNSLAFQKKVENGMMEAVRQARAKLQPAAIGFATGALYLNVNRDAIDPKTRLWAQEPNLDYPSDKTLAVIEFKSPSGDLIAVYMNYAMHAVSLFLRGDISGDFPGAAERYIEHLYDDKVVALWTSGAAGDQNPLYARANQNIVDLKVGAVMKEENTHLGSGIMRAMGGDPVASKTKGKAIDVEESTQIVQSMGQLTAEEAIRVMGTIRQASSNVEIVGSQQTITCPARRRTDSGREGAPGTYEDSPDPVQIRIGALRIGDIVLGYANAEIYNRIGQRLKQESIYHNTLMVTLTNGMANSGYVPTDDAFGRYTFEVLGSRLKPGCAENAIVNGVNDLLGKTSQ